MSLSLAGFLALALLGVSAGHVPSPAAAQVPAASLSSASGPTSRIFFVAGDVAFASPSRGWSEASMDRGLPVRVWRGRSADLRVIAEGRVFRVRPQHVAITLPPGSGVREGDLVAASGEPAPSTWTDPLPGAGEPGEAPYPPGTTVTPEPARAGDLRLLVYNIIQAPRLVAQGFDSHFLAALRQGAVPGSGLASGSVGVIIDAPERRRRSVPGSAELRLQAMRHAADLVLVPVYVGGTSMDAVEVRVFDGRTGNPAGVTASPVRPIPSLVWTASGRRAGRLELVGRWSGLRPAPEAAAVRRDGSVVVRVGEDLFNLVAGEATVCLDDVNVAAGRRVSLGARRPLVATIETIPFDEAVSSASPGGDRVAVYDGDELVFQSGSYGSITGLAVRNDLLLVLAGDGLELLRLHPE